jgi:erythronate-4-phosphate dehydrogenase
MNLSILADENMPLVKEYFSGLGEVTVAPGREINAAMVRDSDILLVRSVTPVNQSLLEGSRVRFVGTATIGTDHVDIEYLNIHKIGFSAAPGCNAPAVVDYVLSCLCRLYGKSLTSKRVGIIGMGNVGTRLAQRLRMLQVPFVAYDPLIDQTLYPELSTLEKVLQADIISLHVPLTTCGPHSTHHLIADNVLANLGQGACLINTSRGSVVDNTALMAVLDNRTDLNVVLDVWENEPDINWQLLEHVAIATPHIAGYSLDGKLRGTAMICQAVYDYYGLDHTPDNNDPGLEKPAINIDKFADPITALQHCYDVSSDDRALRGISLAKPSVSLAKEFDRLRREYPVRREFASYQVNNLPGVDSECRATLKALGFNC